MSIAKNRVTKIHFFYENVEYKVKGIKEIRLWLIACAASESKKIGELNIIFCEDNYLLKINKVYLKHNYLTDIITFDYSEDKGILSGDVFISIERAKENAVLYKQTTTREVRRLLIHGLLHLIGYSDKSAIARKLMSDLEDAYLNKVQ